MVGGREGGRERDSAYSLDPYLWEKQSSGARRNAFWDTARVRRTRVIDNPLLERERNKRKEKIPWTCVKNRREQPTMLCKNG